MPMTTGVDPSWCYGINAAVANKLVFGRDIVFTYGPLGYLIHPLDIGHNLTHALIFRVVVHCLFGATLLSLAFSKTDIIQLILFCIGYLTSTYFGLIYEYHLLAVLALWFYISTVLRSYRLSLIIACCCTALAGVYLFMKFTLGIAALSMAIISVILFPRRGGRCWLTLLIATTCTYFLTCTFLAIILLRSLSSTREWFIDSFELSSAYSVAMSLVGPKEILIRGLLALGIFAATAILLLIRRASAGRFYFLFAFCVFVAFKHGFVRQDAHVMIFFPFLLSICAISFLFVRRLFELTMVGIAFCFIFLLTLPVQAKIGSLIGWLDSPVQGYNFAAVTGKSGWTNLKKAVRFNATKQELSKASKDHLLGSVLPKRVVEEIIATDAVVDIIPSELSIIVANNFEWKPSRHLQFYTIYSPALDHRTAQHFGNENSPDVLLVEFKSIDHRHMLWDAPESWRAIFRNYELRTVVPERRIMVMEKRVSALAPGLEYIDRTRVTEGEWIDIPRCGNLLFAKIDMYLSWYGRLLKIFFRVPPVYVELVFDRGEVFTYRIVPELARNGLQINYVPIKLEQLALLIGGQSNHRAFQFRLKGSGLNFYSKQLNIDWYEMPFVVDFRRKPTYYETGSLHCHTGRDVVDDKAANGVARYAAWWCDKEGAMVFGPYAKLSSGDYVVHFQIRGDGMLAEEKIADLTVTTDEGRTRIAERSIKGRDLEAGTYRDISLPFSLKDSMVVEFPVFYLGRGELWVDRIVLEENTSEGEPYNADRNNVKSGG